MQPPRSLTLVAGAILALAALILPTVPVIPAHAAQTLVVNTTADAGACPGSSCSLRGAINRANADGSGDTITFNIPNSDSGCFGTPKVCHIDVTTTQFPPLTANTTTIDAYTQPGSSKNTLGIVAHATSIPGPVTPQSLGTNADLRIQLVGNNGLYDASLCPGINFGFDVQGHFNTIQGFAIVGFCRAAIYLDGKGSYGNRIAGNFLGVRTDGQGNAGNEYGNLYGVCADMGGMCTQILSAAKTASQTHAKHQPATASPSRRAPGATLTANQLNNPNLIGGSQNWQLNILSFNYGYGVYVNNTGGMVIAHNLIGPNRSGTASVQNREGGIYFDDASHITVGGPNPQYRNIISGNGNTGGAVGLEEESSDHIVIAANFVGAAVNGTSELGNDYEGLYLSGGAHNTVGLPPLGTQIMGGGRNLISGNNDDGVFAEFEDSLTIQYNWIGIDVTGNSQLLNYGDGIDLHENNYTQVKGPPTGIPGHGVKVLYNVISGNHRREIADDDGVYDDSDVYDVFKGNRIGTNYRGAVAIGNGSNGIELSDTIHTTIGGTGAGDGNVLSGNINYLGLSLDGAAITTIQGNKIGPDLSGDKCIANGADYPYSDDGLAVYSSAATLVGGSTPAAANVISCNGEYGVYTYGNYINRDLPAAQQFSIRIQGNYIGTNGPGTNGPGTIPAGTLNLGNKSDGLDLGDPEGQILNNVIAFNNVTGIKTGDTAVMEKISQNSIYRNGDLGIDLDGNRRIDCSGGTSSNPATTCPVITGATTGAVSGTADPGATVEVFVADNGSDNTDPTHRPDLYGEGQTFLGSTTVGGGGHWTVSIPSGSLSSGQFVTATETVPATGGTPAQTSEFSKNMQVS